MHEYTSTMRVWELTSPGLHEEVARTRHFTADFRRLLYTDDAAPIGTDLVTKPTSATPC